MTGNKVADESIHASAVQMAGRGVLILGPSGSGKSSLAMRLIALGGRLIADDRVILMRRDTRLWARPPARLAGLIEARGIGLMRVPHAPGPIDLVVDLARTETDRLPPIRNSDVGEVSLPLVLGPLTEHLSSAICLFLRGGRLVTEVSCYRPRDE
ncbi:MAG: serine kinase [Paracoccus sp. (in: a-proteobacteria)]|nr:serine kinase [Paracoccus sp. (in: a-proteobacteria)]